MYASAEAIPAWSSEALFARDIFYCQFNDVNFYVEDEDQENLYLEILKKLFGNVRIEQVFPLGGKDNVLAHASCCAEELAKKSVYIVDKDFDDLLGTKVSRDNLFYLRKYCIENFLIDEQALVEFVVENRPKIKREYLVRELEIGKFLDDSLSKLDVLFRMFCVVQKLDLGIKNCDHAPEEFSSNGKPYVIDDKRLDAYKEKLISEIITRRIADSAGEVDGLIASAYPCLSRSERDRHVSGKFILAMLFHYVKCKIKCGNVTFDSFTYRLAKNSELRSLHGLRDDISAYLES